MQGWCYPVQCCATRQSIRVTTKGNDPALVPESTHCSCLSHAALADKQPNNEFSFFSPRSAGTPTQRFNMWQVWEKTEASLLKTKLCICFKNHIQNQYFFGYVKTPPHSDFCLAVRYARDRSHNSSKLELKSRCFLYLITCVICISQVLLFHFWATRPTKKFASNLTSDMGQLWTRITNTENVICNDFYVFNAQSSGLFLTLAFFPVTLTSLSRHLFWRQVLGGTAGPVTSSLQDSTSNNFTSSSGILLLHLLAGSIRAMLADLFFLHQLHHEEISTFIYIASSTLHCWNH